MITDGRDIQWTIDGREIFSSYVNKNLQHNCEFAIVKL